MEQDGIEPQEDRWRDEERGNKTLHRLAVQNEWMDLGENTRLIFSGKWFISMLGAM